MVKQLGSPVSFTRIFSEHSTCCLVHLEYHVPFLHLPNYLMNLSLVTLVPTNKAKSGRVKESFSLILWHLVYVSVLVFILLYQ